MIKILFVDDEPLVLEGLQRMLRPMRHEWEMSFAESGAAALALMAATPRDVVVSDMRMPGMDGPQLLAEVTRLHPRTVRLVLSGYADQELIMKSVGLAHQYLSKPCSAEQIMAAIEQACASRDLLTNESLQRLIARMDSLPSLPSLYTQLVSELKSPDASIKRVGEIISLDLGMTAKILQMVNSAFFGLRRRVSNPGDAAMFLGIDTIMSLVLAIHVFSQFNETSVQGFSPQALWAQGMAAGQSAKRIVKAEGQGTKMSEAAFTAGLLHDVGKVVLATSLPEWYGEAFRLEREEHFPFIEAELQVLGIVITMQHIDGPPEELGKHVAAALVGTFLGLLLSYGVAAPIATNLENLAHDEAKYYACIKTGLIAFANGAAPSTAVEFARKTIYSFDRPSSVELDPQLREIKPR